MAASTSTGPAPALYPFRPAVSSWQMPAVPVVRGQDAAELRSALETLRKALVTSFLRHGDLPPADGQIGAGIFEAVERQDGRLQQWLYYRVTDEDEGARMPRSISKTELFALVKEATRIFVPERSAADLFNDLQALRQTANEPLFTFAPLWMSALRRVLTASQPYPLAPGQAGALLWDALKPESRKRCGSQEQFLVDNTELALQALLDVGVKAEEKIRSLEAMMPRRSAPSSAPPAPGGARQSQRRAGTVNAVQGSERDEEGDKPEKRPAKQFKCYLCGGVGHGWSMCSDLAKAQAEAKSNGLDRVNLPFQPRRTEGARGGRGRGRKSTRRHETEGKEAETSDSDRDADAQASGKDAGGAQAPGAGGK